jgi:HK97 family phage prohead protease
MQFAFSGYASLFNVPDQSGDIVLPGAFRRSLAARGPGGIRMLFQHDPSEPVGVWDTCLETARGLYAAGHLLPGVQRAAELAELLSARALDGLSIGFRIVRANRARAATGRVISEIDLWEISIVTFPMLAEARVARTARLSPA